MNKFNRKQEKSSMVQYVVDKIILLENNILSAETEAHENIDS